MLLLMLMVISHCHCVLLMLPNCWLMLRWVHLLR